MKCELLKRKKEGKEGGRKERKRTCSFEKEEVEGRTDCFI